MNGIRTNGSRVTPLAVASGAIASFDAQVAAPLNILKADINPVQAGSGDPSPENVRPISGWDEIKITNESGEIFEAANIEATESEIKAYYDADLLLTSGTYVFSTDATDSVTLIGAQYYSGSWHNIFSQPGGTSRKFTLSRSGKCHFRAELRGSGDLSSNTVSLKQLDERTIELSDTVYGGMLDVTSGKLLVTHKQVDLGDYSYTKYSNKLFYANPDDKKNNTDIMCDSLKFAGNFDNATNANNMGNYQIGGFSNAESTNHWLYICVPGDMTQTALKEYVKGMKAVFELATPIELTIDPISMDTYAGSNKITTDSGNTTACYLKGVTT